jgi:uncharacterized membrane protein YkvI
LKKYANGFKLAVVFTAVILGAGFASGQELLKYFVSYGITGILGLLASGVLFSLVGWATLDICRKNKISNFGAFARFLFGGKLSFLVEGLVCAFLFVLLTAMLAASGAAMQQGFNGNFAVGVVIMGTLCFIVLLYDLKGFVRINIILMPFMVVGGVFVGLYAFFNQTVSTFGGLRFMPGWITAAGVYASYNLVTGVPVLVSASALAENKRDAFIGGVLGGGVMTFLGLCMALPLYLHYSHVISVEIPFLVITLQYGGLFNGFYLAVLICAIFTTAISNAFALIEWLISRYNISRPMTAAVLCLLGMGAAFIGFSNIVSFVYPVFGFLGLFIILVILLSWRRQK